MNYIVEYKNDFSEPYWYSNDKKLCRHINSDTYVVQSIDDVKQVVKDFLDVPTAELSKEEILKDFGSDSHPLSEEKAVAIMNYYNGRLTIWRKFNEDLFAINDGDELNLCYPIPQEYNEFVVAEGEELSQQNDSYINIKSTTLSIT